MYILMLFAQGAFAQQDSLRQLLLAHKKQDTVKVQLMFLLAQRLHDMSRMKEASGLLRQARRLADSLNHPIWQAQCYNELSVIEKDLGNYAEATGLVMLARKLAREQKHARLQVSAAINCANIFFLKGDVHEGVRILREALALTHKDTSRVMQRNAAVCYGNIGTGLHGAGMLDSVAGYYQKALAYYEKYGSRRELAGYYSNYGTLKWDQKSYTEALVYLEKAERVLAEEGDKMNQAAAVLNMAELYLERKDPRRAMQLAQKGFTLATESQNRDRIMQCCKVLAGISEELGDAEGAVAYFERYARLKDSLLNESNNKHIAEMQTRFETEKKEQEIQLLQKDQDIRELLLSEQAANIRRQRLVIYSVVGGLALLLVLVVLVWRGYRLKKKINAGLEMKNAEIRAQKELIEEKNILITDSIEYARHIQQAILPPEEVTRKYFPDSFVLFMPKDIVSGDFYWLKVLPGDRVLFATVDCTGHGVPGAFMSVMAYNMLEQISGQGSPGPAQILDALDLAVRDTLGQDAENASAKYGMDISLIEFDRKNLRVRFAGAHNPLLIVREEGAAMAAGGGAARAAASTPTLIEIKADATTISMAREKFSEQSVTLQPGDMLYLFTDGYADQKGEIAGTKLFAADFRNILLSVAAKDVSRQKEFLLRTFEDWKGSHEQIDDVLLVGIRI